ncbi:hypothetical protein A8139_11170 [Marinomonas primoryensis]|uniref:Uncharacterized protein n=1 Tax=Marinomonas primoryensis TaxID=178399 RepID=A0A2Z4PSQ8_9GAMM|nr:hypothetical protein A8139_11170 [Marinomonas primoryensis]
MTISLQRISRKNKRFGHSLVTDSPHGILRLFCFFVLEIYKRSKKNDIERQKEEFNQSGG